MDAFRAAVENEEERKNGIGIFIVLICVFNNSFGKNGVQISKSKFL